MITLRQIEIFFSYRGDGDGFVRSATSEEKAIIDYKHWHLIDSLLQDINLIEKGLISSSYLVSIERILYENCDSLETIVALKNLANKLKIR